MKFAALMELVGVRELAADTPGDYVNYATNFETILVRTLDDTPAAETYFFRDHCYIETEGLTDLLATINELRRELLFNAKVQVRGAVSIGSVGPKPVGLNAVHGWRFNQRAARLFGLLDSIKAVGVAIDQELVEITADSAKETAKAYAEEKVTPRELTAFAEQARASSIVNYHIADRKTHRYFPFYDLRLSGPQMDGFLLDTYLRNFKRTRTASRKVARFFVPPLVNWARCMDLVSGAEDDLDTRIVDGTLQRNFRDVPGLELVYLTLMDRIYSGREAINQARASLLKNTFITTKWLHPFVRAHDASRESVPPMVLRGVSRRAFIEELSGRSTEMAAQAE